MWNPDARDPWPAERYLRAPRHNPLAVAAWLLVTATLAYSVLRMIFA